MGAVKKLVFVGALAAVGAVIAKKVMESSNENAWESAGGWDSTTSTDWSAKQPAATEPATDVTGTSEQTEESEAEEKSAEEKTEGAEETAEPTGPEESKG